MWRIFAAVGILMMLAGPAPANQFALIHGNYCGFGQKSGPDDAEKPPVDALDAICMRHDQCYDARGNNDCGCDLALMREVSGLNWAKGRSIRLARAVFYGIALLPCSDRAGQLRKIEMARSTDM